ncbi:leucine carboxyl methyltransferase [Diplocarpon rosae]|nr:leucine carboxyl methyltransferase [Diplocarpon rosae]
MSAPQIPNLLSSRGGSRGEPRNRLTHARGPVRFGGRETDGPAGAQLKDLAIQSTDTDAAVSRLSAVSLGYLEDPFASHFVSGNGTRRMPIINRGTYTRTTALDILINAFLTQDDPAHPQTKQVISLGAGTDTRYFRLRSKNKHHHLIYHEFDFPSVSTTKLRTVSSSSLFGNSDDEELFPGIKAPASRLPEQDVEWGISKARRLIPEVTYCCHPMDLRNLPLLKGPQEILGLRTDVPTLIISECCLCYLDVDTSRDVVKWFADRIPSLGIVLYEPIGVDDSFGQVMVSNLSSRGITMPTLQQYKTLADQKARLLELGLNGNGEDGGQEAETIENIWQNWVPSSEKERVDRLEGLDEVEEWQMLARHYSLVWGWRGSGWKDWSGLRGQIYLFSVFLAAISELRASILMMASLPSVGCSSYFTFALFSLSIWLQVPSALAIVSSKYQLDTDYSGASFFDGFEFWTEPDPTHGYVSYQSHASSLSKGLISSNGQNGSQYMGVDHTTVLSTAGSGRDSVRISSKKLFTHGLFVADIEHMPGRVSKQNTNVMTMHSGSDCSISGALSLGTLQTSDCNQFHGSGCSVSSGSSLSYGDQFNTAGGGVYATQWTSDYIRIWFFSRAVIPADIISGDPDPSLWGLPDANFQGSCDIDANFKNHQIVFDTTFCGDWAGTVWSADDQCKAPAPAPASTKAPSSSRPTSDSIPTASPTSTEKAPVPSSTQETTSSKAPSSGTVIRTISPQSPKPSSITAPTSDHASATLPPFPTTYKNTTQSHPTSLLGWKYLGCLSLPTTGFRYFTLALADAAMSIKSCASTCTDSKFLGTFGTSCFCGTALEEAFIPSDLCSEPCPGNASESCGGQLHPTTKKHVDNWAGGKRFDKRAVYEGFLLTVYGNEALVDSPPAPSASSSAGAFASEPSGTVEVPQTTYTTVVTTTYTDLCGCKASTLQVFTVTRTLTLTHCGCHATHTPTAPQIPMTTRASGTMILTVPCTATRIPAPYPNSTTAMVTAFPLHENPGAPVPTHVSVYVMTVVPQAVATESAAVVVAANGTVFSSSGVDGKAMGWARFWLTGLGVVLGGFGRMI